MNEKIIMYSTGCPKCNVLKSKLDGKNIQYVICDDVSEMESLNIDHVPVLSVNGELFQFTDAVKWVNNK